MSRTAMKLALEALMRSRKAVSGDLDLAGCAYGSNDPDGHRYDDAKKALVTLDKAITALREALAEQPAPPPECKTEAEKIAYVFGWFKALESVRGQPAQHTWVGLTEGDKQYLNEVLNLQGRFPIIDAIEAKLKEKNTP